MHNLLGRDEAEVMHRWIEPGRAEEDLAQVPRIGEGHWHDEVARKDLRPS